MIVAKAIKPKRLNDKAMRLTLLNAMRKAGTQIKRDYEGTTQRPKPWKHKVKFETLISLKGGPAVLVYTNDEIYRFVDRGTRGGEGEGPTYEIWAGYYTGKSEAKVLAFPSMFTPKTKRGSLESGSGSSGEVDTFRPYVEHPGIKSRDFTKTIKKRRGPWFKRQMQAAMREARRKSQNPA